MFFARASQALRRTGVRLTLWHSLIFMASAIVLVALTYLLLENRAKETERYVVDSRLSQFLAAYHADGIEGVRQLSTLRRNRAPQAVFVRVADARNETVFLRHAEDWSEFRPEAMSKLPMPNPGTRKWRTRKSEQGTELIFASERLPDGGLLSVGKSNEELLEVLADYRHVALVVLLVMVPVSFAGGAFLSLRALRPVQQLTQAAKGIVETARFDTRVPSRGTRDELDALVQVFNDMLQRIESLIRGMRDSLDNIAHDLRTPLTRLRHRAQEIIEVDASQPHNGGAPVEALADCVEEADRMAAILNTLMDIAEAEAGLARLNPAPATLLNLLSDAVESCSVLAAERGISVTTETPPDLRILADATAMFRVFANLLDNAIKYTPPGGRVKVTAERGERFARVVFEDTGSGIAPEDLDRVWERLFRGNRPRTERGLGLGLSFVRAIVVAHGGTAEIASKPGTGTVVTLSLPIA